MGIVFVRQRLAWSHAPGREITSISKVALSWTTEGKRKRGHPKSTRRKTSGPNLNLLRTDKDGAPVDI